MNLPETGIIFHPICFTSLIKIFKINSQFRQRKSLFQTMKKCTYTLRVQIFASSKQIAFREDLFSRIESFTNFRETDKKSNKSRMNENSTGERNHNLLKG